MNFLQISTSDLFKGFIMAVLTVVVSGLYTALQATPIHFPTWLELQSIGLMGLAAGLAYLMKQFLTNSDGKFLKKESNAGI